MYTGRACVQSHGRLVSSDLGAGVRRARADVASNTLGVWERTFDVPQSALKSLFCGRGFPNEFKSHLPIDTETDHCVRASFFRKACCHLVNVRPTLQSVSQLELKIHVHLTGDTP